MTRYASLTASSAALVLALACAGPAAAQTGWGNPSTPATSAGAGQVSGDFMRKLEALIDKGERERLADPAFLYQLRQLTRSAQYPWSKKLLEESFADGNYTANPQWLADGEVSVDWRGARLVHIPQDPQAAAPSNGGGQTANDPAAQIFGLLNTLKNRRSSSSQTQQAQPPAPTEARLSTQMAISNAFAIRVEVDSRGPKDADRRLLIGPYQNVSKSDGYRLAYVVANQAPRLELIRITRSGSAIVEVADGIPAFEDGKTHQIDWRRHGDGTMTVLVDGNQVMQTRDQGFRSAFTGLTMATPAGDYSVRRVVVDGM